MSRLALIAGQGRLPLLLAEHLAAGGIDHRVFAMQGFAPDGLAAESFPVEHLGSVIARLAAEGYARVCFAGAVRRPQFDPARLDAATAPLVPGIAAAMRQGDDALLRHVIALFEAGGLEVVGAGTLRPDLIAAPGVLAGTPGPALVADAARAGAILDALAPLDVGQAAVVAQGLCLGIETIQGTAALLDFVGQTRPGSAGVLAKRAKPGQDRRIDLPSVGPQTIEQAARAGLAGIAIEAGAVLLLDRDATCAAADAAGIALWAT